MRAGLLDREDAVLHAHLAVTVAGLALADLAVFRTAAVAMMAIDLGRYFDLPADAEDGLLQIQLHDVAQVGTATRATATTTVPAENVAEDVTKISPTSPKPAPPRPPMPCSKAGVAVLVVHRALLRVGQHFVGLLGLLEFLLRSRVVRAAVRVVFHRQPTEGFLQLDFGDAALDAQHFVVVTLAHSCFHTACRLLEMGELTPRSFNVPAPSTRQPVPGMIPARAAESTVPIQVDGCRLFLLFRLSLR
jgi:hypothetical protein